MKEDKMNKMPQRVIVSYVPLFYEHTESSVDRPISDLDTIISKYQYGSADGCVWFSDENDDLVAYLMYPKANEIAEHLYHWSEDKPEHWFDAHFHQSVDGRYVFMLNPRVDRSKERYGIRFQLAYGYPMPKDHVRSVYFQSLTITSQRSPLNFKSPKIRVFLINTQDFDINHPENSIKKAFELGSFNLEVNSCQVMQAFEDFYE